MNMREPVFMFLLQHSALTSNEAVMVGWVMHDLGQRVRPYIVTSNEALPTRVIQLLKLRSTNTRYVSKDPSSPSTPACGNTMVISVEVFSHRPFFGDANLYSLVFVSSRGFSGSSFFQKAFRDLLLFMT